MSSRFLPRIEIEYKSTIGSKLYLNPPHRHFENAGGIRAMNFGITESLNIKISAYHLNQWLNSTVISAENTCGIFIKYTNH